MNIKLIDVFGYLFKWKFRILIVVLISVLFANRYVGKIQTYDAEVVIKFNDECVSSKEFPDGSEFDVYDFANPVVLKSVIDNKKINKTVDSIRQRIIITPIIPDEQTNLIESKMKQGEEYVYNPNTFDVKYVGLIGQSESEIRDTLEAIALEYVTYYSNKYGTQVIITNTASDYNLSTFDYVEEADVLSANISSIKSSLQNCQEMADSFRSSTTGYSFFDLNKEYEHLKNIDLPSIYAKIYAGQIAKDKNRLVDVYQTKAEEFATKSYTCNYEANMIKSRIEAFSTANKDIPNAYNKSDTSTTEEIDVIDNVYHDSENYKTKTTYDTLMENYAIKLVEANDARINSEHCQDIVRIFSGAEPFVGDPDAAKKEVEEALAGLVAKMTNLYNDSIATLYDFNDYRATKHITLMTTVNYYGTVNALLYKGIALAVSFSFMLVLAIGFEIYKSIKLAKKEETIDEDETDEDNLNNEQE